MSVFPSLPEPPAPNVSTMFPLVCRCHFGIKPAQVWYSSALASVNAAGANKRANYNLAETGFAFGYY